MSGEPGGGGTSSGDDGSQQHQGGQPAYSSSPRRRPQHLQHQPAQPPPPHQQQQQPPSAALQQMGGYVLPPPQPQPPVQYGGYQRQGYASAAAAGGGYPPPPHYAAMAGGGYGAVQVPPGGYAGVPPRPVGDVEAYRPRAGRLPSDRPIMKLSVGLIETYKEINSRYYDERAARRAARAARHSQQAQGPGPQNDGWDDENYDYILTPNEVIHDGRYQLIKRIGKGSFGQVVKAVDTRSGAEVAIKIIKSRRPFQMQARTEINLLELLNRNDGGDQHNIVRLLGTFFFRNHQCIVFEMLSLNLYELLKNTQFAGVSLNLIRKFAKQILKALAYLARDDIDVIHCDLKPENILLRHPKRSGIKVIDFGSSCRSTQRMYSYIQSRFYRSPEVMLGLPYGVPIDMWSLGCILVEMHTGEPLFSGSNAVDQFQKIVAILGMPPMAMIDRSDATNQQQFFERPGGAGTPWSIRQPTEADAPPIVPSGDPVASLNGAIVRPPESRRQTDTDEQYAQFVGMIHGMLAFEPSLRITPSAALEHPFIRSAPQT